MAEQQTREVLLNSGTLKQVIDLACEPIYMRSENIERITKAVYVEVQTDRRITVKEFAKKIINVLDEMGMERASEYNDGYDDGVADCITNIKSCFNELYGEKV